MMHIAWKQGMTIARHSSEANAVIKLPTADADIGQEAAMDQGVTLGDNAMQGSRVRIIHERDQTVYVV